MLPRLASVFLRRAASACLLIFVVSSSGLLLARVAPGDHLHLFDMPPHVADAERRRLGLDQPLHRQYVVWAGRAVRLDLGESTRYPGRSVTGLLSERAGNSALLGSMALALATLLGIPLGVLTGSRPAGAFVSLTQGATIVLLSIPPVVLSLVLLLLASRTGWFPLGGLPDGRSAVETVRYLTLPVLALALPVAAALERLQSRSMADTLGEPSILAARGRGLPRWRVVWRHAFRLSLEPVLSVYGIIIGALISGSFVVEYVMAWPGLGRLMYDALIFRDGNLVAGCAAVGAAFLAGGILAADLARVVADPRLGAAR